MSFSYYKLPYGSQTINLSKSTFENDWLSIPHSHDCVELMFIAKGKGELSFENNKQPLYEGQLILVNGNVFHREVSDKKEPLTLYYINFSHPAIYFEPNLIQVDYHNFSINPKVLFETADYELANEELNYRNKIEHLIQLLMIDIMRAIDFKPESVEAPRHSKLYPAIKYINEHYNEKINVRFLANLVHMSSQHFARLFKQEHNISPHQFITQKRIDAAKFLLSSYDHSINSISDSLNYSDVASFIRAFKAFVGKTPKQYKNAIEMTEGK